MKRIFLIVTILSIIFFRMPLDAEEQQLFYVSVEYPDQGSVNASEPLVPLPGTLIVPVGGYVRLYLTAYSGYEPAGYSINGTFREGGLFEYKVKKALSPITIAGAFRPVQDVIGPAIKIVAPYESGMKKEGADNTISIVFICQSEEQMDNFAFELYKNDRLLSHQLKKDINGYFRYENIPLDNGDNVIMVKAKDNVSSSNFSTDFVMVHYSSAGIMDNMKAAIIIDERLYTQPGIAEKLSQYASLASARISSDFEISINPVYGIDDFNTDQVRAFISELKNTHKALEGVLLVGNIKLPSFFKPRDDIRSSRLFTHKYEDLDIILNNRNGQGRDSGFMGKDSHPGHGCNADYSFMEKGQNPLPEIWCAIMPVGFDDRAENNEYMDFAVQLNPYLDKLVSRYNYWFDTFSFYQLSNRLWDLNSLSYACGLNAINFYSVNDTGLGPFHWCTNVTPDMFYNPLCTSDMNDFCDVSKTYRQYPWMGEGWQSRDIYMEHMQQSFYSVVWTDVSSWEGGSVISTQEAKNLTNGGIIQLVSGCSVAGFRQYGSSSYVDTDMYPDGNILCGYVYGNSNCLTAMGSPFNRGHESEFEKLAAFLAQGDYAGKAHFFRKCLQYHNAGNDPDSLKILTQEILIGDPFAKVGYSYEMDVTPPTQPQNLACTDIGYTSMSIQWDQAADDYGVSFYNVKITDNNSYESIYTTGDASYVFSGLEPNTPYTIMVQAKDTTGNGSEWTLPLSMTTKDKVRPSIPDNLICSGVSDISISLSWDPSSSTSGISGYEVFYASLDGDSNTISPEITSVVIEPLSPETAYTIKVRAYDNDMIPGLWSEPISVTTTPIIPPTVPQNLKVIDVVEHTVTLAWDPSIDDTGIQGYFISYTDPDGNEVLLIWSEQTTITIDSLKDTTMYTFKVQAYDTSGNLSDYSEPVTAVTKITIPPTVPQNLTAAEIMDTTLSLTWDPSTDDAGITGYQINVYGPDWSYESTYYNSAYECLYNIHNLNYSYSTTENQITINSLKCGSTFKVTVRACDIRGNVSDWSAPVIIRTTNPALPIPQDLEITSVADTSVNVAWDRVKGDVRITGYTLEYTDPDGNRSTATIPFWKGSSANWSLTRHDNRVSGLKPDTPYTFRVRATGRTTQLKVDAPYSYVGSPPYGYYQYLQTTPCYSDWTDPVTVRTEVAIPPTVPLNLRVTEITYTSISLAWDPASDDTGVSGYNITCTGTDGFIIESGSSDPYRIIDSLEPDTGYTFKVRARDTSGNYSDWSSPVTGTTLYIVRPAIVQNLTCTEKADTRINLSWEPSSSEAGISYYQLHLTQDGYSSTYYNVDDSTSTVLEYLVPETTYTIAIRAYDNNNISGLWSSGITVTTTPVIPPTVPQNLIATGVTDISVSLSWDPSSDDTGIACYNIKYTSAEGYSSNGWSSENNVTLYGLAPGIAYTFIIQANDTTGNASEWSQPISITTKNSIPPTIPQNVTVTGITETSVILVWDPSSDDTGIAFYNITYISPDGNTYTVSPYMPEANATIDYLNPGTTYTFQVQACDTSYNVSEWSEPVTATTTALAVPAVPYRLKAVRITEDAVTLEWHYPHDALPVQGYAIIYTGSDGSAYYSWSTKNRVNIDSLEPNTTYTFRVMACDESNTYGGLSDPVIVTTLPKKNKSEKYPGSRHTQEQPLPDLIPTEIVIKGDCKAGSQILFESGVSNIGKSDSGKFKVMWLINNKIVMAEGSYENVSAGTQVTDGNSSITWTPHKPGEYMITFILDSKNMVAELNNHNNISTITVRIER